MRGSDTSYGIFLSHMLVISLLVDLHWRSLEAHLPWPVVVAGAALMAFGLSALLTAALARTCLSRALTGQARLRRRRRTSSEVAAAT
jgi:peptidoglycan/LPS O-acetylase OafA/YrhL